MRTSLWALSLLGVILALAELTISQTVIANCVSEGTPYTNGTARCNTCKTNFYPTSDRTQCCPPFCSACSSAGDCAGCLKGYYLLNSRCEYCPSGCTECTSAKRCTSCSNSYYLATNYTCQRCMPGCVNCTGAYVCTECSKYGYFKQGTQCQQCIDGCQTCSQSSTCDWCETGRFSKTAYICGKCSANCAACASETKCTRCNSDNTLTDQESGDTVCVSTIGKTILAWFYILFIVLGSCSFCVITLTIICVCAKKGACSICYKSSPVPVHDSIHTGYQATQHHYFQSQPHQMQTQHHQMQFQPHQMQFQHHFLQAQQPPQMQMIRTQQQQLPLPPGFLSYGQNGPSYEVPMQVIQIDRK